jgi:ubiquinone/menaquinone biosynthesis C-methylase UbiE
MTIQRADFQAPLWTKQMGRRHRVPRDEDNYFLPGDLQEAARLKLQDDLMRLVWGELYYAPLHAPRSIIDIACGDALWGYQMAKQFPGGRVVNLDIDSVPFRGLLESYPLPHNFEFLQADALAWPLLFPDGSFQFVHSRFPDTFLSHERFPSFLQELSRITQQGSGWVEILVADLPHMEEPTTVFNRYYQAALALPTILGLCGAGGPRLKDYFHQAGIEKYCLKTRLVGKSNKRQKVLLVKNILAALKGMRGLLDQFGLLSQVDFDRDLAQLERDLHTHQYTIQFHRVWWQPDPRQQKVMWLPLKREEV